MASWIVHLRVADALLDRISNLSPTDFVVGNIAPDSGVPNEDWSVFTPNTNVSHFKRNNGGIGKDICIEDFLAQYSPAFYANDIKAYSFYLGYLTHLLTDMQWSDKIARPKIAQFAPATPEAQTALIWEMKEDWYDLDFLYLQEHPHFRSFHIYKNAVGFRNEYMDIFSPDAFDNRRKYIVDFYSQIKKGLDREYPYLSKSEMDHFVEDCTASLLHQITAYGFISI